MSAALQLVPITETHPLLPVTRVSTAALDLVDMVLSQIASGQTRRMYRLRLIDYLRHRESVSTGVEGLTREGVGKYLQWMETQGHGIPARNQALSAIKLLAKEAELRGLITGDVMRGIVLISHTKQAGVRTGNWLSLSDLELFYSLPDRKTLSGLRDAVCMALLCACGLRRNESVTVTWEHYQEREGRMALIDVMGKGNRIRSVVVPEWAERDLNNWHDELSKYGMGRPDCRILAGMPKWGTLDFREKISCERVYQVIRRYAVQLVKAKLVESPKHKQALVSPHDLRRTLARLMYEAEANIVEIQMTLGHQSLETTQRYLGSLGLRMGKGKAAVDKIQFKEKGNVTTDASTRTIQAL